MEEANDTEDSLRGILNFVFDPGRMVPIIPEPGFPVQSPFQDPIQPFMRIERGFFPRESFWSAPKYKSPWGVCEQKDAGGIRRLVCGGWLLRGKHQAFGGSGGRKSSFGRCGVPPGLPQVAWPDQGRPSWHQRVPDDCVDRPR